MAEIRNGVVLRLETWLVLYGAGFTYIYNTANNEMELGGFLEMAVRSTLPPFRADCVFDELSAEF